MFEGWVSHGSYDLKKQNCQICERNNIFSSGTQLFVIQYVHNEGVETMSRLVSGQLKSQNSLQTIQTFANISDVAGYIGVAG